MGVFGLLSKPRGSSVWTVAMVFMICIFLYRDVEAAGGVYSCGSAPTTGDRYKLFRTSGSGALTFARLSTGYFNSYADTVRICENGCWTSEAGSLFIRQYFGYKMGVRKNYQFGDGVDSTSTYSSAYSMSAQYLLIPGLFYDHCMTETATMFLTGVGAICAGKQTYGECGKAGSNVYYFSVRAFHDNMKRASKISCGLRSTFVLDKEGNLFGAGDNSRYTLGLGHNETIDAWQQVPNLPAIEEVSAYFHVLALAKDGVTVYSWGDSWGYRNGLNLTSHQATPTVLNGPWNGTTISKVKAGPYGGFVLTAAGDLYAFGEGNYNMGFPDSSPTPTLLMQGIENLSVSSSCVQLLRNDSTLWVFGENDGGSCGTGSTGQINGQALAIPFSDPVTQMGACHNGHFIAYGEATYRCNNTKWFDPEVCSGRGRCTSQDSCSCTIPWSGDNCELLENPRNADINQGVMYYGGQGAYTYGSPYSSSPVGMITYSTETLPIITGLNPGYSSYGTHYISFNDYYLRGSGQMSYGIGTTRSFTTSRKRDIDGSRVLSVAYSSTAVVILTKLGVYGATSSTSSVVVGSDSIAGYLRLIADYDDFADRPKSVQIANDHWFLLTENGTVYGMGENTYGRLGVEHNTDVTELTKIDIEGAVDKVSGGLHHTIFLHGGNFSAAGRNTYGLVNGEQPGADQIHTITSPPGLSSSQGRFIDIATLLQTNYAVDSDHKVYCWGYNNYKECGFDSTDTIYAPTNITELGLLKNYQIVAVGASAQTGYFLATDGTLLSSGLGSTTVSPMRGYTGIRMEHPYEPRLVAIDQLMEDIYKQYPPTKIATSASGIWALTDFSNDVYCHGIRWDQHDVCSGNGKCANSTVDGVGGECHCIPPYTGSTCSSVEDISSKQLIFTLGNSYAALYLDPQTSTQYYYQMKTSNFVTGTPFLFSHSPSGAVTTIISIEGVPISTGTCTNYICGTGSSTIYGPHSPAVFDDSDDHYMLQTFEVVHGISMSMAKTQRGLFTTGLNSYGELAQGFFTLGTRIYHMSLFPTKTKGMSIWSEASFSIDWDGNLWGCGRSTLLPNATENINTPVQIMQGALEGKTVAQITSGNGFWVALTSDNELVGQGTQTYLFSQALTMPTLLNKTGAFNDTDEIIQIVASEFNLLALSSSGVVGALGINDKNQLHSVSTSNVLDMLISVDLQSNFESGDTKITRLSAFRQSIMGLTDGSNLYSRGYDPYGVSGTGLPTVFTTPTKMRKYREATIANITAVHQSKESIHLVHSELSYSCNGTDSKDTYEICNGHGFCQYPALTCKCWDSWTGTYCDTAPELSDALIGAGYNTYNMIKATSAISYARGWHRVDKDGVEGPIYGISSDPQSYGMAMIAANRTLWTKGYNSGGKLGLGHTSVVMTWNKPEGLPAVRKVCHHASTIMVMTENGVWGAGSSSYGQFFTHSTSSTFRKISDGFWQDSEIEDAFCAYYFTAIKLKTGDVYVGGRQSYGQMGLYPGDTLQKNTPTSLNLTLIGDMKSVSSNDFHTVYLSSTGKVSFAGYGYQGRLCRSGSTTSFTQITNDFLDQLTIQTAIAGDAYSVFLTNTSQIYFCGYNSDYRVGHTSTGYFSTPTLLDMSFLESGDSVKSIWGLRRLYVVSEQGRFYVTGSPSSAQLTGLYFSSTVPGLTEVNYRLVSGESFGNPVSEVVTGNSNFVILLQEQDAFNVTCSGVKADSVSVCSGHGTCNAKDSCSCSSGYGGSDCEVFECYGLLSSDSNVCSGNGQCSLVDECSCNDGYVDSVCSTVQCFGINANASNVCNGQGNCTTGNTCVCPEGVSGDQCQFHTCYGTSSGNSTVCSGRGICTSLDNCTCTEEELWGGIICQTPKCANVLATDAAVCNSRGTCIASNNCTCDQPSLYLGSDCQYPVCYGLSANSSSVCSGHGSCQSPDTCVCHDTSQWQGTLCHIPVCNGTLSTDSTVCNNQGNCTAPGTCQCSAYYFGQFCEVTQCFGLSSNDSSVCSGHGSCTSPQVCQCDPFWNGAECSVPQCDGILANVSSVCRGHGQCVGANNCSCVPEYEGEVCNLPTFSCNNVSARLDQVCSGNGNCSVPEQCTCDAYWYGGNCEVTQCFGLPSNDTSVCSGHGSCTGLNQCQCTTGYYSDQCDMFNCYDIMKNASNVCQGNGQCISPNNCSCVPEYEGTDCLLPTFSCYNVSALLVSNVCSGNGLCSSENNCTCHPGYNGTICDTPTGITCGGKSAEDTANVCSGRGNCTSQNNCQCPTGYTGSLCENAICYGVVASNPDVCGGKGECQAPDSCQCQSGWQGSQCQTTSCNGILSNSSSVCSGKGQCIDTDVCLCQSGLLGFCDRWECFGYVSTNSSVCSGNGVCSSPQTCSCNANSYGPQCQYWNCFDKLKTDTTICGGKGVCQAPNSCQCQSGYSGAECNVTTCSGTSSTDSSVCSNHGSCTALDTCTCSGNFDGPICSSCLANFQGSNCDQRICDPVATCQSRGTCSAQLECVCSGNYAGTYCHQCKSGFYTSDCSVFCNATQTCSGNGQCHTQSGNCTCFDDDRLGRFQGLNCSDCQSGWYGSKCAIKAESQWQFNNGKADRVQGTFFHHTDSQILDCTKFIKAADQSKFGAGPICQWTQTNHGAGQFEIVLGSQPTLLPGDTFDVWLDWENEALPMTMSTIAPSVSPQPTAVLDVPTSVGACYDLSIDASQSSSPDRRPLTYSYAITTISSDQAQLTTFIQQQSSALVTVPNSLMSPGYTYTIAVTVKNFLNQTSTQQTTITKSLVSTPLAKIQGPVVQQTQADEYFTLDGSIEFADCIKPDDVQYQWKQLSGPTVPIQTAAAGKRLIFPGSTFANKKLDYQFQLTTSLKDTPSALSQRSVTVQVSPIPMTGSIQGGEEKVVPANQDFVISADISGYNASLVSFKWQCINVKTNGLCPNFASIPTEGQTITIREGMLGNGGEYRFEVTMTYQEFTATSSALLEVQTGDFPLISYIPLPEKINIENPLILQGQITSSVPKEQLTFSWTMTSEGKNVPLEGKTFTPLTNEVLGIKERVLEAGQPYEFKLEAQAQGQAVGYSIITTTGNFPPLPGVFEVSPKEGEVLLTEFTLSCLQWTDQDNDTPLKYGFNYIDPESGDELVLVPPSVQNTVQVQLPRPGLASQNFTITLIAIVQDQYEGITRATQTIVVKEFSYSNPEEFADKITESFDSKKAQLSALSSDEKINAVDTYASTLNSIDSNDPAFVAKRVEVKGQLFDLLNSTLNDNDGTVETESKLTKKMSTVENLSKQPSELTNQTAQITKNALDGVKSSEKLTASSATTLANSLDAVFKAAGGFETVYQNQTVNGTVQLVAVKQRVTTNSPVSISQKDLFSIGEAVSRNLAAQQVVGQDTTTIVRDNFAMAATKRFESDLSGDLELGSNSTVSFPNQITLQQETQTSEDGIQVVDARDSGGVAINALLSSENPFPNSDNISTQIFSVSFEVGGQGVIVNNLDDPIVLQIPGSFNLSALELNETKAGFRPKCQFWDTTTETWRGEGCNMTSVTETLVVCSCNHLTDFASAVEYATPNVNIPPSPTSITNLNADNMTALIVACCMFGLYVGLMVALEVLYRCGISKREILKMTENVHSPSRALFDKFLQGHIWVSVLKPPSMKDTHFTRSQRLTIVYITILGVLLSNALTFGREQKNVVQTVAAAFFSDMFCIPFVIAFTMLFVQTKPYASKPKTIEHLPKEVKENPFSQVQVTDESLQKLIEHGKEVKTMEQTKPWEMLEKKPETHVQKRIRAVQHIRTININGLYDPSDMDLKLSVPKGDEATNIYEKESRRSISEIVYHRIDTLFDVGDYTLDQLKKLKKKLKKVPGLNKVGVALFAIFTILYFSLIAAICWAIMEAIEWLGVTGVVVVVVLSVLIYFGGFAGLFIVSRNKMVQRIQKQTKKNSKMKKKFIFLVAVLSTFTILDCMIALLVVVLLFSLSVFPDWFTLPHFITVVIGLLLLIVLNIIFMFVASITPKKKKKKKKRKTKQVKLKIPGILPWWFRYPIFALCFLYIAVASFWIVLYGIQFDSDPNITGQSSKWFQSSFMGLGQNVLANKPVVFLVKVILLASVSGLLEDFALAGLDADIDIA